MKIDVEKSSRTVVSLILIGDEYLWFVRMLNYVRKCTLIPQRSDEEEYDTKMSQLAEDIHTALGERKR